MVAYVYRTSDNVIIDKVINVKNSGTNSKGNFEINGNTKSIFNTSVYSYIILDDGIVNKNVGDLFERNHYVDKTDELKMTDYEKLVNQIGSLKNHLSSIDSNIISLTESLVTE